MNSVPPWAFTGSGEVRCGFVVKASNRDLPLIVVSRPANLCSIGQPGCVLNVYGWLCEKWGKYEN